MQEKLHLEIYCQRYETFRHLDKMRWQMLQIAVAIGSFSALVIKVTDGPLEPWFLIVVGSLLLLISYSMKSIDNGIKVNGAVLSDIGSKIGDDHIPKPTSSLKSSSTLIIIALSALGLFILVAGIFKLICGGGV